MKGNEAMAEAAMRAGCRFFFGYPITPQTEVAAYMAKMMPKVGGTYLQAESEVAAINMVYGASAAGARVHDLLVVPGNLAEERGHLAIWPAPICPASSSTCSAAARVWAPSSPPRPTTGRPPRPPATATSTSLVYAPSTVQEMADYAFKAFDTADKYRMPVMIMADGMLGQMMEPVVLPEAARPYEDLPEKPWAT